MSTSRIRMGFMVLLLMLSVPTLLPAQEMTWFINDGPNSTYLWEDTSLGPFWEWMAPDAIAPEDTSCTYTDLPTGDYYQPLYAATAAGDVTYTDQHFWAELYLDNAWTGYFETVSVTLGTGIAGAAGTFSPVAGPIALSSIIDTGTWVCGAPYLFDFGVLPSVVLSNSSLILKIDHPVDTGGVTHIFWDSECCPSALHMSDGTATDESNWSRVKTEY